MKTIEERKTGVKPAASYHEGVAEIWKAWHTVPFDNAAMNKAVQALYYLDHTVEVITDAAGQFDEGWNEAIMRLPKHALVECIKQKNTAFQRLIEAHS